jgi:hypothetical protein
MVDEGTLIRGDVQKSRVLSLQSSAMALSKLASLRKISGN